MALMAVARAAIWATVAAGRCMSMSIDCKCDISAGLTWPLTAAAITCGATEAGRWMPIIGISAGSIDAGGAMVKANEAMPTFKGVA